MTQNNPVFNPEDDDRLFLNVYTQGASRLGRLLTNLADIPVHHPRLGRFACAEGLWYYLKTGCKHEDLRALKGFAAKKYGMTLSTVWLSDFEEQFKAALYNKIHDHKELLTLFVNYKPNLPFVHFYVYRGKQGTIPKVVVPRDSQWQMEYFNQLRKELRANA